MEDGEEADMIASIMAGGEIPAEALRPPRKRVAAKAPTDLARVVAAQHHLQNQPER
jgi:hypothetical protein